jgi:hypothetical protein
MRIREQSSNMTRRIQKHLSELKQLCRCGPKKRKEILKKGGRNVKLCLSECALNVLKGNVPLNKKQFSKLKRHRKSLQNLSKKNITNKKSQQLVQRGGFLPLLLSPILGALTSAAIKGISSKIAQKKKKKK